MPHYDRVVSDIHWLNEDQQRQWRAVVTTFSLLPDQLGRDLSTNHELSLTDYEILVRLSESTDHRMRMSELAAASLSSRSRLSHQVTRLERAGLVAREACKVDRRGWYAMLTDQGYQALVSAAPDHVDSVRRHFVDLLTPEQFAAIAAACEGVNRHLQRERPEE